MDATTRPERRPALITELRRRRVLHIGAAYLVGAWLAVEVLGFLLEQAGASESALRWVAIAFVAGFPVSVILAWAIQVQPDGAWAIDRSANQTNALLGTAALAAALTGGLAWTLLPGSSPEEPGPTYDPIPNSVAILPLAVADSTPLQKTIAETLYYTLLDEINRSRDVTQIRLRMRDRPADLLGFGRSVRVGALLDGAINSVRGGTLINLRLLDVRNGKTIWSAAFPWDATRILELGTEIGNQVFRAMGAAPSRPAQEISPQRREAHELLLLGKRRHDSLNSENLRLAVEDARGAIELDPGYAQAYAYLANWTYSYEVLFGGGEEGDMLKDQVERALQKALELDPELPLAISELGYMQQDAEIRRSAQEKALALQPDFAKGYFRLGHLAWRHDGDLAAAEKLFRKALRFDPMNSNFWSDLGGVLSGLDRTNEAVAAIEKSIELDPSSTQNYQKLAWIHNGLGNIDQLIYYMRKGFSIDPRRGNLASYAAWGYADLSMKEEALAWVRYGIDNAPRSTESEHACCGPAHALLNEIWVQRRFLDCERIREAGEEMVAVHPDPRKAAETAEFNLGMCLLRTGELDRSAELTEKVVDFQDPDLACLPDTLRSIYFNRELGRGKDDSRAFDRCLRTVEEDCVLASDPACLWLPHWAALTGNQEKTLEALARVIIDARYRHQWPYYMSVPWFDFLRSDPEFERIMAHLHEDIARQRENVLRMEANGEMPPVPEVAMH